MTTTSQIIEISVSKDTTPVSRASQTYPLILTEHTSFQERSRVYTSLAAIEDDFSIGSTTHKMANGIFSQSIAPSQIVIGRKQVDGVSGLVSVANLTLYTITVNGELASFTSDASATAIEIIAGLKLAVDALAETGVTFTDNVDGTFDIDVTAGLSWSIKSSANVTLTNTTLTETWVAAKSAVQDENNSWYALLASTHVKADQQLLAAAIEAERKIYITSTSDAVAKTMATTDIGAALKALSYERTGVIWSEDADVSYPECGWTGRQLQDVPGSNDWSYKEIVGTVPDSISDTATFYLHDKNYTTYETLDGVNRTVGGDSAKGTPVDEVVFIDWMVINLRADLWQMFANIRKVPYDKNGITMIESKIRAVNSRGIANGGITESPAPQVVMPILSTIPLIDKANRHLPGIQDNITLAGSIRTVAIRINVSL